MVSPTPGPGVRSGGGFFDMNVWTKLRRRLHWGPMAVLNPTGSLQILRNTAYNWTNDNPVLTSTQVGYETDTRRVKYGDDVTPWQQLPYVSVPPGDPLGGGGGSGGTSGQPKFSGHGVPANIVGAQVGDEYLDLDTGLIYQFQ